MAAAIWCLALPAQAAPTVSELSRTGKEVCKAMYPEGVKGCDEFLVNVAVGQSFLDDSLISHYNDEFSKYGVYLLSAEQAQKAIAFAQKEKNGGFLELVNPDGKIDDMLQQDLKVQMAVLLALASGLRPKDWKENMATLKGHAALWHDIFPDAEMSEEIFIRDVKAFQDDKGKIR